jgi:hypothetical protein
MRARDVLVSVAVLACVPALAQEPEAEQPAATPPPGVTLTGRWRLDPDQSDDPGQKVREAREGVRTEDTGPRDPTGPGGVGTPTGPGGVGTPREPVGIRVPRDPGEPGIRRDPAGADPPTGPGVDVMTPGVTGSGVSGDPFGRGSSGSGRSQPRAAFAYVLDLPETLTIAQRPALILIQENDDEGRVRGLHPDGARHQVTGTRSATRTHWEKGRLHVETWREDGVDVDEVFAIAPDRSRLTVTVTVVEGATSLVLERVFLPDESED